MINRIEFYFTDTKKECGYLLVFEPKVEDPNGVEPNIFVFVYGKA